MQWPEGTSPQLEIETSSHNDEGSAARVVTWIPWDSGFRGSGLRVSDLIVGHGDLRYDDDAVKANSRIGDSGFSTWLEKSGLKPDDSFTLQVQRGDDVVSIQGRLGGYRTYKNADGHRMLSQSGPVNHEKDGFDYAWDSWYRQFVDLAKTILAGWDYFTGTVTKNQAEQMKPFADRVAYLEQHYPSALAKAVRDDFEAMKIMVAGEKRELSAADIAYRSLGEARAKEVTAAADQAFAAFLAELDTQLMQNPPEAPNSFTEDTRHLVGKMVRLPAVGKRELLFETKRNWYWSGRYGGGYLIDKQNPSLQPLYVATDEYIEKVDPNFRDPSIEFVGIVQAEPALVCDVYRNVTVSGVRLEPIAALVANAGAKENRFFVDLRPGKSTEAFAGEAALEAGIKRPKLVDEASPAQVLTTAFEAMKVGDMETWLACYANWMVRSYYERDRSFLYVDHTWETLSRQSAVSAWDRARQRLMDDVYGLEVVRVGPVRVVYDAAAQPSEHKLVTASPRIVESVRPLVNHIGKIGDEYRTFSGFMLHRRWELQRLDNGPWRITVTHAI
ncbi:hypothetical protein HPT27_13230 [Permianibacter sp. IMCC34836]|uniref:hypothetical protein n=1 Tax=Permianibacter fluminis TaxID=2738515 RepID=UPI00155271E4|nr:hypothetical protein [Permianibacter fluminis]NQD37988.1 hypothetical protein [Permianibacter fluminis]